MLQKQGRSTSCYASIRRINSCMQSSKANREIDRKTSRCWTNRKMWIPQIPTPRKASCSVLVHNSAHHLPWITGWKQEPAAEEMHQVAWVLFCEIYTLKAEVFFGVFRNWYLLFLEEIKIQRGDQGFS